MFLFFRVERRNQDDNFQQHSSNQHNTEAIGCEPHPDGCRPHHLSSPSFLTLLISLSLVAGTAWCRWRGSNPHEFQSISLMRGETSVCCSAGSASPDFNPLPSCEGRLADCASALHLYIISIHSPHARGDQYVGAEKWDVQISIHSPHPRGDVT